MTRIWFHEWGKIVADGVNATGNLRGIDDEILRSDGNFHDDDGNLHDGVKSVRGSVNDDRFSHDGDENEGSDEEGNDMTESDGDGGIRSVRIDNGSHVCDDRRVNGDDESGDQSDDDNRGRKFQGRCF